MATVPALREVCRSARTTGDRSAADCTPRNKVTLGFVEGLNNTICVIQRRSYGKRDEEYLQLKILTAFLPREGGQFTHSDLY